ncbi:ankyrin repeat protein [Candidatus Rubidus massiliensis]|nr:ankyrin repeat protein [Candidatus Rubidus massiliensis]
MTITIKELSQQNSTYAPQRINSNTFSKIEEISANLLNNLEDEISASFIQIKAICHEKENSSLFKNLFQKLGSKGLLRDPSSKIFLEIKSLLEYGIKQKITELVQLLLENKIDTTFEVFITAINFSNFSVIKYCINNKALDETFLTNLYTLSLKDKIGVLTIICDEWNGCNTTVLTLLNLLEDAQFEELSFFLSQATATILVYYKEVYFLNFLKKIKLSKNYTKILTELLKIAKNQEDFYNFLIDRLPEQCCELIISNFSETPKNLLKALDAFFSCKREKEACSILLSLQTIYALEKKQVHFFLIEACKNNWTAFIKNLAGVKKVINQKNEDSNSPIFIACNQQNYSLIKLLIECGALIDDEALNKIKFQNPEIFKYIFKTIPLKTTSCEDLFRKMADKKLFDLLSVALDNLKFSKNFLEELLCYALGNKVFEIAKKILEKIKHHPESVVKPSITSWRYNGFSAFNYISPFVCIDLYQYVKKNHPNLPLPQMSDEHNAVFSNNLSFFTNTKDTKLYQDAFGNTPLHWAVEFTNDLSFIPYLKKYNDIQNNEGETPLHLACKNSKIHIVRKLLLQDVNTEIENHLGKRSIDFVVSKDILHLLKDKSPISIHGKRNFSCAVYFLKKNENALDAFLLNEEKLIFEEYLWRNTMAHIWNFKIKTLLEEEEVNLEGNQSYYFANLIFIKLQRFCEEVLNLYSFTNETYKEIIKNSLNLMLNCFKNLSQSRYAPNLEKIQQKEITIAIHHAENHTYYYIYSGDYLHVVNRGLMCISSGIRIYKINLLNELKNDLLIANQNNILEHFSKLEEALKLEYLHSVPMKAQNYGFCTYIGTISVLNVLFKEFLKKKLNPLEADEIGQKLFKCFCKFFKKEITKDYLSRLKHVDVVFLDEIKKKADKLNIVINELDQLLNMNLTESEELSL